jgi:hypothetical protein
MNQTFNQLLGSYKSAFGAHWAAVFQGIDPKLRTHLGLTL